MLSSLFLLSLLLGRGWFVYFPLLLQGWQHPTKLSAGPGLYLRLWGVEVCSVQAPHVPLLAGTVAATLVLASGFQATLNSGDICG